MAVHLGKSATITIDGRSFEVDSITIEQSRDTQWVTSISDSTNQYVYGPTTTTGTFTTGVLTTGSAMCFPMYPVSNGYYAIESKPTYGRSYDMNVQYLQTCDPRTATTLEALFLAQADLEIVTNGYLDADLEVPEWVYDKADEIVTEINARRTAELKRQLKKAEARLETYKEKTEKRADAEAEIKKLKEQLG